MTVFRISCHKSKTKIQGNDHAINAAETTFPDLNERHAQRRKKCLSRPDHSRQTIWMPRNEIPEQLLELKQSGIPSTM
jgi:hypothetical protein